MSQHGSAPHAFGPVAGHGRGQGVRGSAVVAEDEWAVRNGHSSGLTFHGREWLASPSAPEEAHHWRWTGRPHEKAPLPRSGEGLFHSIRSGNTVGKRAYTNMLKLPSSFCVPVWPVGMEFMLAIAEFSPSSMACWPVDREKGLSPLRGAFATVS